MERTHFALRYRLGSRDRDLIWFSHLDDRSDEDHDGVFVAPGGSMPCFASLQELRAYAEAQALTPLDDGSHRLHDLDVLACWLHSKRRTRARHVDCPAFLSAWNLFADLSLSLGASFDADHRRTQRVYDKLFWGNNLPALTPPGRFYVPIWPKHEVKLMHQVLADGLTLFRASVRLAR